MWYGSICISQFRYSPMWHSTSSNSAMRRARSIPPPLCDSSKLALQFTCERPSDWHLLTEQLEVFSERGGTVEGNVEVAGEERVWRFTPRSLWEGGDLMVVADPALKDVAGNNFRDLLDHKANQQQIDGASNRLFLPHCRMFKGDAIRRNRAVQN